MKYWYVALCCLLFACEKDINLQPNPQPALMVVDGQIENGSSPVVFLSKSLSFFSTLNANVLADAIVKNAIVTISNGTKTVRLKEYVLPLGGGLSINYYAVDSSHPQSVIVGQSGKSYTLTIDYEGSRYISVTSIPIVDKTLDSLWWKKAPNNEDSSKVVVMGRFTDPPGLGDYIRYFTRVNSQSFLPGINSVFDDNVIDGTTYEFQIDQGVDRNNIPPQKEYGYFNHGDTVTIKYCNIDKATFDFWRTLEFSYQSTGNPFSTPTKVIGNVSNGALGAFCGYGAMLKTIVVPK